MLKPWTQKNALIPWCFSNRFVENIEYDFCFCNGVMTASRKIDIFIKTQYFHNVTCYIEYDKIEFITPITCQMSNPPKLNVYYAWCPWLVAIEIVSYIRYIHIGYMPYSLLRLESQSSDKVLRAIRGMDDVMWFA